MQKVVQDSVDLTEKYTKAGITEDSFVKDGYLLELMLLSALRSDSLSSLLLLNLGVAVPIFLLDMS